LTLASNGDIAKKEKNLLSLQNKTPEEKQSQLKNSKTIPNNFYYGYNRDKTRLGDR
jgi:hypothetical protein